MVAREVRDRDSSDTTETPDFGGGEELVAPGPIVGADGPTEPEGPEGGAEAAEAAEREETGDGPAEPEGAVEGGAGRPERVGEGLQTSDCAEERSIPKGNHRKRICARKHFRDRKTRKPRAKEPERKEKGSP